MSRSIVSRENIQNILDSKNSHKLIKAIDASYMNDMVFNKFARTFAEREGIRTDTADVLNSCREKTLKLYGAVADYFNA